MPPPSAKPAWCGDPVEPRGPAQPRREDRVLPVSPGPRSRLPSLEARVPGSALQAGRGQAGGGVAVPPLPGRSGSGTPPPRGGGGRAGQQPRAGAPRPRAGPGTCAAQVWTFSGEELRGPPGQPPGRRLKRFPGRAGLPPPYRCHRFPGNGTGTAAPRPAGAGAKWPRLPPSPCSSSAGKRGI